MQESIHSLNFTGLINGGSREYGISWPGDSKEGLKKAAVHANR
jgi:hypothetical protein